MEIQNFKLVDPQKIERALNGTPRGDGTSAGGIGNGVYLENGVWMRDGIELEKEEVTTLEAALLAEYDRIAGYIVTLDGDKVKTGSFFDFKAKKPRSEPKIIKTYRINGKVVDVVDGEKTPGIVEAAKQLEKDEAEQRQEKKAKKIKRNSADSQE